MSGRTGWYYRVLEEGTADPSDRLDLVERPRPDWPLTRLVAAPLSRQGPVRGPDGHGRNS